MKKFMIFFIVFYIAIIAFMPKENLYYTLKEAILKPQRVIISEDSLSGNLLSLRGEGITVFYDGIASVKAAEFSVLPFILYNKLEAFNIEAAKDLKSMFGFSADSLNITYAIWDYNHINIVAEGDFGSIKGTFEIKSQIVKLFLEPSAAFEKSSLIREYFKKSEEGYVYESKIK